MGRCMEAAVVVLALLGLILAIVPIPFLIKGTGLCIRVNSHHYNCTSFKDVDYDIPKDGPTSVPTHSVNGTKYVMFDSMTLSKPYLALTLLCLACLILFLFIASTFSFIHCLRPKPGRGKTGPMLLAAFHALFGLLGLIFAFFLTYKGIHIKTDYEWPAGSSLHRSVTFPVRCRSFLIGAILFTLNAVVGIAHFIVLALIPPPPEAEPDEPPIPIPHIAPESTEGTQSEASVRKDAETPETETPITGKTDMTPFAFSPGLVSATPESGTKGTPALTLPMEKSLTMAKTESESGSSPDATTTTSLSDTSGSSSLSSTSSSTTH